MKGLILNESGIKIAEDKEYYASRAERLLFEPEGGILGAPDWGSRMNEFFFEPEDESLANEMINEASFLFSKREDILSLSSMSINIIPTTNGSNGFVFSVGVEYPEQIDEEQEIKFFKIIEVL